jgi:hypothetical protein
MSDKKVKYHVPPNILREKCGVGGINPDVLKKAQTFIDENDLDFTPFAEDFLNKLDVALAAARKNTARTKETLATISRPVMELKANGAMFEYPLISDVAGILLNFLENLQGLNDDALDIVIVHRRTLHVIVTSRLRGTGGKDGQALLQELVDACERYFKKYAPDNDED